MARPAPGADRAVAVLELLASHPDDRFTLSEVARQCALNKATAHALLHALNERGVLLRHPEERRYSLGPRLVAIGDAARRGYGAVDFVPSVLDDLSTGTGLWARAWHLAGDHLACVAQAGAPPHVDASAEVRVPLVPPLGAVFMAWSDAPSVEAWLARAGAVEAVRPALEALPLIRDCGVAVTLTSRAWHELCGGRRLAGLHDDPSGRRSLVAAVGRESLLVGKIDEAVTYPPVDVAVPVFGSTGQVELSLSVTRPTDEPVPGTDLQALAERVKAAADGLIAAVRGRRP